MKKLLLILIGCLLVGCSYPPRRDLGKSNVYALQGTAPGQWIHIGASARALDIKEVPFQSIAEQLRFDLRYHKKIKHLSCVKHVYVDYAILPPQKPEDLGRKEIIGGQTFYEPFHARPKRYYMNIRFYTGTRKPPAEPDFQETMTMPADDAAPYEAFHLMAQEIMIDQVVTPTKKIRVEL